MISAKPPAPVITSVECEAGGTLPSFRITWQSQQGPQGPFYIAVTDSAGDGIDGNTIPLSDYSATWTAAESMNAATDSYQARVQVNPGIVSDPAPLLFAPDTDISTQFDGVTLSVSWTPPASQTAAASTRILLQTPAGTQAVVSTDSSFGQMIVGPKLRHSGGDWLVYLTPRLEISSGPTSDPVAVMNTAPAVTAVTVFGAQTTMGALTKVNLGLVIMVPGANVNEGSFLAVLKADGRVVRTSGPITGTWQHDADASTCTTSVEFTYPLSLAAAFEVAAAQSSPTAGRATGPIGVGSAIVLFAPQAISATVTAQDGDRAVTASVSPLGGPSLNASRIAVKGPAGTQIGTPGPGFQQSLTLTAPTIGGAYTLFGAQANGNSIGPWSGGLTFPGDDNPGGIGLALITTIPQLVTIDIDQGIAALTWNAITDAGLTGYRVSASVAGSVVASAVFTGTSGNLAVSGDGVAFSIAGVAGSVTGPAQAAVTAITAAPAGLSAGWASVGTQCKLQWQVPVGGGAAPDGYTLEILSGETVVHRATPASTSYEVPADILTAAGGFSFRVAATASAAPKRSGPWSAPAPIVSAAPTSLAVNYNGATLSAAWATMPGVTGYRVALPLDGAESGSPWFTADPSTSVALAFDNNKTYSLAVQATGPGTIGPAATAAVFGTGFYPQFAANTAPALIPANAPAMAPFAIAIGLPQIFTSTPESLPSEAPFTLSAGTAPYTYVLTIAGTAGALPWTFTADAVRADLYEAYGTFLGKLDTAGATPFGVQTVQAAIARAMPQTFAETLLYAYGFDGSSGFTDLKPGMVLRIEYESYQTMGSATPNQAELNGFITSAVAQYQITRGAKGATGFTALDAFIGALTGLGGTSVPEPPVINRKQAGGGGLIDSGYDHMQQGYLRLIYPTSFPATNQVGTPYPELNALLIAASKLSDLTAATNSIRSGGPATDNVGVLYFRGRTTLTPQIRIWVNDVQQYVPLGTTVGELLAERAMDPSPVDLPLTGLKLRRGISSALVGSPSVYDAGASEAVYLDWAPSGKAALTALPLLGGDRVTLGSVGSAA